MFLLAVSLVFTGEYSKGQSTSDVSKFSTRPDIGTEEEPTINDDAEEEETMEDDETEPTDEEENDTVTSVPPKRSFGADLGLDNLTTAPTEEPAKLIFSSCQKDFPNPIRAEDINRYRPISCNVPGASPNDNVVVSNTPLDPRGCNFIASSRVSAPNNVSILLFDGRGTPESFVKGVERGGLHGHEAHCDRLWIKGTVIFSIIVFRPEVPDIIGSLEELQDKNR